ncbi:hypothetical protein Hdeb2414_s0513g00908401 [Helianthus debilis subsp. tardiflorus]
MGEGVARGLAYLHSCSAVGIHVVHKDFKSTKYSSEVLSVSGLSGTKDVAQEYVLTGVGLLAGSAILLLTLTWGTCVIVGGRKFSSESGSSTSVIPTQNQHQKLSYFTIIQIPHSSIHLHFSFSFSP